ncbi:hypothetical protein B9Z55_002325 [Caenorhabditis nigoni]|uniref:Uncharacterized protein n=2 Tax=Caenorhabditis nigoni TaxID=1611254 RepID=A0A2G5VK64_9PELO|nr:hypothetical protein B9Z55_002325 [Caenorhabditis nigoni]
MITLFKLSKQSISVFTITGNGATMTRVRPTTTEIPDATTSKFHTKGIEALVTMAAKLFGAVSRKLERRQSTSSSDESIESGMAPNVHLPAYTQSSTRKLAFGTAATEEHKPLDDFYNNSTLTNISKLFCAIVLLTAFFLVMSRSLQFAYEAQQAAAAAARAANPSSISNSTTLSSLFEIPVNI